MQLNNNVSHSDMCLHGVSGSGRARGTIRGHVPLVPLAA